MIIGRHKKPVAIIILDGWGIAPSWGGNAVSQARTRNFDILWQSYPSSILQASGVDVGLLAGSPGNSEAGHLNIGAGHIVRQDAGLIDAKIKDGSFFENKILLDGVEHARKSNSNIHIMGLLSDVGTHSDINHLFALLRLLKNSQFNKVYIHLFSDGRDSPPMSGIELAERVEKEITEIGVGSIASLTGRFYSMDRDNRWGRIARAYNLLVKSEGNRCENIRSAFSSAYAAGMTDEFIEPRLISDITKSPVPISDNDTVFFFNFRGDRAKELTEAFMSEKIAQFPDRRKLENLYFASFVIYQDGIPGLSVFKPESVNEPIAKVWSDQGLKQYHSAETEKYPHITYFINGGAEKPFPGEDRLLVPSLKSVKTYDLSPAMSAQAVANNMVVALKKNVYDTFMINFANPDMVGHTGSLTATIQAVEFVDKCLGEILSSIINLDGTAFILADHGNAEQMVNPHTGAPDTEHSTNPVPFVFFNNEQKFKNLQLHSEGNLSSAAPTILEIMGLPRPESMTGQSLIMMSQ